MADRRRIAAALEYLGAMRDRAAEFGSGVAGTLANRARDVGGLAYEAFTSDPNIGRMNTAEFAQAAASRAPTPRLDAAGQGAVELGRAVLTQPVQTGKALVQGEVDRARQAMTSPRAAGEYAGSMVDPLRLASALRRGPMQELDVYHGTPHRFEPTEANPLGEFDASKVGTGEGAQAYGHGVYFAETPDVAKSYKKAGIDKNDPMYVSTARQYALDPLFGETLAEKLADLRRNPNDQFNQKVANYLEKNFDTLRNQSGSLYKADLPDEMIDRMLDWDKPLSEQPEIVKALRKTGYLKEAMQKGGFSESDIASGLMEGRHLLSAKRSGMAAESEALRQAGIPGVRYFDAGSRGDTDARTRNFVVFPGEEKKVKILRRE
jgi:hypothetical protein